MQSRTPPPHAAAWLTQCMRDVKAHKIQQVIRPYPSAGAEAKGGGVMPVRGVVATTRIHRGEHIATVKAECVLTGRSAAQLLQRVCRRHAASDEVTAAAASPASSSSTCQHETPQPVSAQSFDEVVRRIAHLPLAAATPPHLLLSRDALLMTAALYVARSPLHEGVRQAVLGPMASWVDALPRRPPPMGALLKQNFTAAAAFTPLPQRLRLGHQVREVVAGDDVAAASTELMVQAVEAGEVDLAELRQPTVETALAPHVLTNYFKGHSSALTVRQHAAQRARTDAAGTEDNALHLFLRWEQHLQTQLVHALLPALLLPAPCPPGSPLPHGLLDSPAWSAEEAALRWAHFMVRSRAVNLHWRRPGPPALSLIPLIDMLNHSPDRANVVYHCDEDGDVAVTASQTIQPGEELLLRYNHVGQRGCLFGDQPRPSAAASATAAHAAEARTRVQRGGRATTTATAAAAVAREVAAIEQRQYRDVYAQDEDEAAVLQPGTMALNAEGHSRRPSRTNSPPEQQAADLARQEAQQEVQWLWRYGFLRSTAEKNREAAQLWSRELRTRIAHLTDVRRKGKQGEFVIGVPEGLQHLREQRAQLERERYANHRVFPPQQP